MLNRNNGNWLKTVLFVLVCVAVGALIPSYITVSLTPSLPQRVFLLQETGIRSVKQGDYVRFPHSDAVTGGETVYMLKRVGCTAGQFLSVDGNKNYYCDGRYLGRAKDKTLKGNEAVNFVYEGLVPKGTFFAVADHKDSYDSKYYGFVSLDRIVAKAYPIL